MTNIVQHHLQNLFAQTQAGEANRQRRNRSFDWKDGEEVDHFHAFRKCRGDIEGVGYAKKSGEGRQMRAKRCTEGKEGRDPVPGVKMIGRRNFD